jgi:hypothetical protein
LKRRGEEKASPHQSLVPKMRMMKAQTMKEKILAKTVVTAAAAATVTLKEALDARNLFRRLISLAEIVEKFIL